jgi:hypothetical protein
MSTSANVNKENQSTDLSLLSLVIQLTQNAHSPLHYHIGIRPIIDDFLYEAITQLTSRLFQLYQYVTHLFCYAKLMQIKFRSGHKFVVVLRLGH